MDILFRYACLIALGLASAFAFVSATAVTGQRLAATSGYAMQSSSDGSFMVLALIGMLGLLSVLNFVVRRFPSLVKDWYGERKNSIATLMMAGIVCVVFVMV